MYMRIPVLRLNPQSNKGISRLWIRHSYSDSSRPFPPPQPTRPIEPTLTDEKHTRATEPTISSTLDAVADDTISHKKDTDYRKNHHFDTYHMLTQLENKGFTRGQAEAIMKGIKFKLRECTASVQKKYLLTSDLENESYLFKAALSELRTEIQVLRRNDMQTLQTDLSLITREVDLLEQNLNESVANMRNDIQLDMNNRKNETREDQKVMDMKIQEVNNKFIIRLGDIRTDIEAVRWETIWKGLTGITVAALTIASLAYLSKKYTQQKLDHLQSKLEKEKREFETSTSQAATMDSKMFY